MSFFDPLPLFCADLMVVDPPSDFDNYSTKGEAKGPRAQYETMSNDAIAALPVGHLAGSHCWLLLWGTAPKLNVNIRWLEGWGFKYVTELVWDKRHKSGKKARGTGYVARNRHESVLIGKIGEPLYRKPFDSLFEGVRREHSRKPDEFYAAADRFVPAHYRKLDLFARQSRPGWTTWGREASKFDLVHSGACADSETARSLCDTNAKPADEDTSTGFFDQR